MRASASSTVARSRQLAARRRGIRDRDTVGTEELDRVPRCIEMVVRRVAVPCPPTVMSAWAVLAVGQPQDRVRAEA
jgi:hypothetical protein